jgi:hypothetical protein
MRRWVPAGTIEALFPDATETASADNLPSAQAQSNYSGGESVSILGRLPLAVTICGGLAIGASLMALVIVGFVFLSRPSDSDVKTVATETEPTTTDTVEDAKLAWEQFINNAKARVPDTQHYWTNHLCTRGDLRLTFIGDDLKTSKSLKTPIVGEVFIRAYERLFPNDARERAIRFWEESDESLRALRRNNGLSELTISADELKRREAILKQGTNVDYTMIYTLTFGWHDGRWELLNGTQERVASYDPEDAHIGKTFSINVLASEYLKVLFDL